MQYRTPAYFGDKNHESNQNKEWPLLWQRVMWNSMMIWWCSEKILGSGLSLVHYSPVLWCWCSAHTTLKTRPFLWIYPYHTAQRKHGFSICVSNCAMPKARISDIYKQKGSCPATELHSASDRFKALKCGQHKQLQACLLWSSPHSFTVVAKAAGALISPAGVLWKWIGTDLTTGLEQEPSGVSMSRRLRLQTGRELAFLSFFYFFAIISFCLLTLPNRTGLLSDFFLCSRPNCTTSWLTLRIQPLLVIS